MVLVSGSKYGSLRAGEGLLRFGRLSPLVCAHARVVRYPQFGSFRSFLRRPGFYVASFLVYRGFRVVYLRHFLCVEVGKIALFPVTSFRVLRAVAISLVSGQRFSPFRGAISRGRSRCSRFAPFALVVSPYQTRSGLLSCLLLHLLHRPFSYKRVIAQTDACI